MAGLGAAGPRRTALKGGSNRWVALGARAGYIAAAMDEAAERYPGRRQPSLFRRLLPLAGVALLAWVLSRLDAEALRAAVGRVKPSLLLASCLPFLANVLVKGLRWWRLLAAQGHALPLGVALAAYLGGQFYGQVTIGRLGEFYRMEALLERGVSPGQALSSCIVDRIFDLFVVLVLGAVMGAFIVGHAQAARAAAGLGVATLAVIVAGYVVLGSGRGEPIRHLLSGLATRPTVPTWLRRPVQLLVDVLFGALLVVRPGPLVEAVVWTLIAWVGYFGTLLMLAAGLGVGASPATLTGAASMAALSALLPVTFSGLGARELIYQEVLGSVGVAAELAVVTALLHLSVMSAAAIGGGAIGLLIRRRQRGPSLDHS